MNTDVGRANLILCVSDIPVGRASSSITLKVNDQSQFLVNSVHDMVWR